MQLGANRFLIVVLARVHDELIREPIGGNDAHVRRDDLDFLGRGHHFIVGHEQLAHLAREANLVADDLLEVRLERAVAREQIVEVPIQKAILPHEIGHVLQVRPGLVDGRTMIVGQPQALFDRLLELREDAVDDVVLVAEVVVEIAWADLHLFRDRGRGDVRLADLVEELQR